MFARCNLCQLISKLKVPTQIYSSLWCWFYPADTGRKLNVHKTFRRRHGHLLNVLCTFNLGPVSTRIWWRKAEKSSVYFENIIHIYTPVLYKTAVVEFTQKIVCVDAHTTLMILSESWHLKLVLHINSQHIVAGSKKSYLDS